MDAAPPAASVTLGLGTLVLPFSTMVALPYAYWTRQRRLEVIEELELTPTEWTERLSIYPRPASLVFDRSLHFLATLEPRVRSKAR